MSDNLFTDVRIFPVNGNKTIKANGKVLIANVVEVSFSIMEGKNGTFVSLPAKKVDKDGVTKYYPEVRIPDEDTRKMLEQTVMAAWKSGATNTSGTGKATTKKPFAAF